MPLPPLDIFHDTRLSKLLFTPLRICMWVPTTNLSTILVHNPRNNTIPPPGPNPPSPHPCPQPSGPRLPSDRAQLGGLMSMASPSSPEQYKGCPCNAKPGRGGEEGTLYNISSPPHLGAMLLMLILLFEGLAPLPNWFFM